MFYEYPAVLTLHEDGSGYLAEVPDLPGCMSSGETVAEAIDMITDAMSLWLLFNEDEGLDIPMASDMKSIQENTSGITTFVSVDLDEYRAMLEMYPPDQFEEDDE